VRHPTREIHRPLAASCSKRTWSDAGAFDAALDAAVATGRVRSLGGVLFEAADAAPGGRRGAGVPG